METGNTNYIYKNEFGFNTIRLMANKRAQSDRFLRGKALKTANNSEKDGYQSESAAMNFNIFDKKSEGSGIATLAIKSVIKCQITYNLQVNFINQLLKNLKEEFIFHLKKIFEVLI